MSNLLVKGAIVGVAAAWGISALLDDGIKGCTSIEGRAHWVMDDNTVSEKPVRGLSFSEDGKTCYSWNGGGSAPDIYTRFTM